MCETWFHEGKNRTRARGHLTCRCCRTHHHLFRDKERCPTVRCWCLRTRLQTACMHELSSAPQHRRTGGLLRWRDLCLPDPRLPGSWHLWPGSRWRCICNYRC
ncbi:hypothetical protein MT325_m498L [Paramecium bursaria chlorella virus MT325]|uniref:Uncharacterized protein m498L n=1 Tax=Paramecium bursaria Chlorella virus MT325 TaxID=346932 RepID=A7IUM8_PBCVM|nr:hypothetical protein MT325_m498L [Paramecium bursaria chlorella virus MT325]